MVVTKDPGVNRIVFLFSPSIKRDQVTKDVYFIPGITPLTNLSLVHDGADAAIIGPLNVIPLPNKQDIKLEVAKYPKFFGKNPNEFWVAFGFFSDFEHDIIKWTYVKHENKKDILTGKVTDGTNPIPGVVVTWTKSGSSPKNSAPSAADGTYSIDITGNTGAGEVEVNHSGYLPYKKTLTTNPGINVHDIILAKPSKYKVEVTVIDKATNKNLIDEVNVDCVDSMKNVITQKTSSGTTIFKDLEKGDYSFSMNDPSRKYKNSAAKTCIVPPDGNITLETESEDMVNVTFMIVDPTGAIIANEAKVRINEIHSTIKPKVDCTIKGGIENFKLEAGIYFVSVYDVQYYTPIINKQYSVDKSNDTIKVELTPQGILPPGPNNPGLTPPNQQGRLSQGPNTKSLPSHKQPQQLNPGFTPKALLGPGTPIAKEAVKEEKTLEEIREIGLYDLMLAKEVFDKLLSELEEEIKNAEIAHKTNIWKEAISLKNLPARKREFIRKLKTITESLGKRYDSHLSSHNHNKICDDLKKEDEALRREFSKNPGLGMENKLNQRKHEIEIVCSEIIRLNDEISFERLSKEFEEIYDDMGSNKLNEAIKKTKKIREELMGFNQRVKKIVEWLTIIKSFDDEILNYGKNAQTTNEYPDFHENTDFVSPKIGGK